MKKTIITGVIIVTLCIIYLTCLAGDALKSSIQAQDVRNELIMNSSNIDSSCCSNTLPTYQKDSVLMGKDSSSLAAKQPVIAEKDSTKANKRSTELTTDSSNYLDSIVYNLTLAVNAVNNVLTSGSIFIAILTLFIGLVGLFGFYSLKSDLKDKTTDYTNNLNTRLGAFQQNIDELSNNLTTSLNESISNQDTRLEAFQENIDENNATLNVIHGYIETLSRQEHYINQTINYLFQATSDIINQMSNQEQARDILGRLYHEMQIARLYRTSLNAENINQYNRDRFAVFAYLEVIGTTEDIPHLEFVVQHDLNENNRRRAIEVIAVIRNRA